MLGLVVVASYTATGQILRSETEGVIVDVSVTRGGRVVSGLTAVDFELTDSGVRQTILAVTHGTLPLDVTIVASGVRQGCIT
jgi:hypothetical protein